MGRRHGAVVLIAFVAAGCVSAAGCASTSSRGPLLYDRADLERSGRETVYGFLQDETPVTFRATRSGGEVPRLGSELVPVYLDGEPLVVRKRNWPDRSPEWAQDYVWRADTGALTRMLLASVHSICVERPVVDRGGLVHVMTTPPDTLDPCPAIGRGNVRQTGGGQGPGAS